MRHFKEIAACITTLEGVLILISILGMVTMFYSAVIFCIVVYSFFLAKRMLDIKMLAVRAKIYDPKIPELIKTIIEENISIYMIYNFAGAKNLYISEEQEVKMKHEVVDMVLSSIDGSYIEKMLIEYYGIMYNTSLTYLIDMNVTNTVINTNNKEPKTVTPKPEHKPINLSEFMSGLGMEFSK